MPEEIYFTPLRILNLNLFIKSFVNPFADIALIFIDKSFNSFLFDATSFSLLSKSKSVLFTKLAISHLLAQFACFSLALKFSNVDLLNS